MIDVLILLAAGVCDRIRGGFPEGRHKAFGWVAQSVACAAMVVLLVPTWQAAVFGLVWGQLAWRQDNGWRGDWVRGGTPYLATLRWGVLWATPAALASYWFPPLGFYVVAAPLGAVAAMHISVLLPVWNKAEFRHAWPWSEFIELMVIGAIARSMHAVFPIH